MLLLAVAAVVAVMDQVVDQVGRTEMTKWPENTSDCLPLPLQILAAHMQHSLVFTQIDNRAKQFTTLVTLIAFPNLSGFFQLTCNTLLCLLTYDN